MEPMPSQPSLSTSVEQIIQALIAEIYVKEDSSTEYRCNDGKNVFIVTITRSEMKPGESYGMYVSLGPAGKTCQCCKGSGKRP